MIIEINTIDETIEVFGDVSIKELTDYINMYKLIDYKLITYQDEGEGNKEHKDKKVYDDINGDYDKLMTEEYKNIIDSYKDKVGITLEEFRKLNLPEQINTINEIVEKLNIEFNK